MGNLNDTIPISYRWPFYFEIFNIFTFLEIEYDGNGYESEKMLYNDSWKRISC